MTGSCTLESFDGHTPTAYGLWSYMFRVPHSETEMVSKPMVPDTRSKWSPALTTVVIVKVLKSYRSHMSLGAYREHSQRSTIFPGDDQDWRYRRLLRNVDRIVTRLDCFTEGFSE